jgi:hypothetical protein
VQRQQSQKPGKRINFDFSWSKCSIPLETVLGVNAMAKDESVWMNPESFVEKFWESPALLGTLLEFLSKDNFTQDIALSRTLMSGGAVTVEKLRNFVVRWARNVTGVADRKKYATWITMYRDDTCLYPIVDKVADIVIHLDDVGHGAILSQLYLAHHKWSDDAMAEVDMPAAYLLEGCGYYMSSRYEKFFVGQRLFDNDCLDKSDAVILDSRIEVITSQSDFLKVKANFF